MNSIQRFRANLQDEIASAALYAALARSETDPARRDLFLQLARAEDQRGHAAVIASTSVLTTGTSPSVTWPQQSAAIVPRLLSLSPRSVRRPVILFVSLLLSAAVRASPGGKRMPDN